MEWTKIWRHHLLRNVGVYLPSTWCSISEKSESPSIPFKEPRSSQITLHKSVPSVRQIIVCSTCSGVTFSWTILAHQPSISFCKLIPSQTLQPWAMLLLVLSQNLWHSVTETVGSSWNTPWLVLQIKTQPSLARHEGCIRDYLFCDGFERNGH